MRIIITGATGSLGAYFTRWFSKKGHQVLALGRTETPPPQLLGCAQYINADITKPLVLPEAEVCIHCAGLADDKAKFSRLVEVNVEGTKNIMTAARLCKKLIHISSSSVYLHSNEPALEDRAGETIGNKLSAYGKSKLMSEEIVAKFANQDSCFILRPRAIYGAGDKVLLPRLLKLVRNGTLNRPGNLGVKLSLTHFNNLAQATEDCINSDKTGLHTYNVADDEVYILHDVVRKLLSALYISPLPERMIPLTILKALSMFSIGDVTPLFFKTVTESLVLDISKIKRELNYLPLKNLDSSLSEIKDWVKTIGGVEVLKAAAPSLAWTG